MASQKQEFQYEMTCGGCANAAKNVLKKIGVAETDVEVDLEGQKLYVTSDQSVEKLTEALKKTGKAVNYIGTA